MAHRSSSRTKKASVSCRKDRLSALPDGVLQHVLGFLPAVEAVRTSMLARRWRHQWRYMRRLHITAWESDSDMKDFVYPLLLLCGHGSTLDEVRYEFDPSFHKDDTHTNSFIRLALLRQARILAVKPLGEIVTLDYPLVSGHLRKLVLSDVVLNGNILDFASCPALEDLEMTYCRLLYADRILSQSVKRLRIKSGLFGLSFRTRISVPSLVWLQLDNIGGKGPLLESMPSLETAFVRLIYNNQDYCHKGDFGECCGICANCSGEDDHNGGCVLLGGLSSAINLELIADSGSFIFKRDLRWCPTFSKLKTLLLNDWCVAVDLRALLCILEHSPVLEKLTLQLSKERKCTIESEGSDHLMEQLPAISERLNIVEIKCGEIDGRVFKILKFLSRFVKQINVILGRISSKYDNVDPQSPKRQCNESRYTLVENNLQTPPPKKSQMVLSSLKAKWHPLQSTFASPTVGNVVCGNEKCADVGVQIFFSKVSQLMLTFKEIVNNYMEIVFSFRFCILLGFTYVRNFLSFI